ncbi:MAG: OB-fold nucleic acid binding domain-containing protein, partial [Peptoniphilaceae bacterium]|nr:OB-fold nucleic acid binding domain-containing protein [Peptoniphilaceae bacterium]
MTQSNENELRQIRREKLARLQEQGQDPFLRVSYDQTHHTQEILDQFDQLEGKNVSIAGRLMFKRVMGKASFCNIQDRDGHIQCYVTRDDLGEEAYALFKKSDIGDIWGVQGFVFRTKTGEITVHAKDMVLLSKSLEPLPEKFHGLQDTDLRFRQRYLDLIMNEGTRITFRKRSQILSEIRKFLEARDFIEV